MRVLATFIFCIVAVGCKPTAEIDLYASDVIEVYENKENIRIPVKLGIPIASARDCEADQEKIIPPLRQSGAEVKFVDCEIVSGQIYDMLNVEIGVYLVGKGFPDGLFGFKIGKKVDSDEIIIILYKNQASVQAINLIRRNYPMQNMRFDDIDLSVRLHNDLRKAVTYRIDSSFVNSVPIDRHKSFSVNRREWISIVPSDVRRQSLLQNRLALLATIVLDE